MFPPVSRPWAGVVADPLMFVDYAKIYMKAGDGGDGCISFRREKYVPRGGPDGGDGGKGGDIYLMADPHMTTLLDVKANPHYTTKRGQHGMGSNCTGRAAEDLIIKVPLGTMVSTAEDGELLVDMTQPGQLFLAAKGGKPGAGNQHYATSRNKAPRKFQYGGDGEERTLILELKSIADVGLVGSPNAGKSTLLSKLTSATPRIASYPFTTMHPNLGVMEFSDDTRCTIADIPGLIEGAHTGAGLGDRFLRHIERTSILVHLVGPPDDVDPALADAEHYLYAHKLVNEELSAYGDRMMRKPQIVCVTKIDLLPPEIVSEAVAALTAAGHETLAVSADTGEGIDALIEVMHKYIAELREEQNPGPVEELQQSEPEPQGPPAPCEPPRKNADEGSPEEEDESLRR